LNAIHDAVSTLCPQSYAAGELDDGSGSFLVTDFLDLSPTSKKQGSGESLAQKLAKLHSRTAPVPDGYDKPMFGFPVTTCCGDTAQDNSYKSSWADFYANNRLRHVLKAGERKNGKDAELTRLVEETVNVVVPRLLGDDHLKSGDGSGKRIQPVVVHGDLWSGNYGRACIAKGGVEEMVFDPSAAWAHSEYEFGIMKMFGGFGGSFNRVYHEGKPKDAPIEEWVDRVELYELYHHLNHYAIFGRGYRGGAVRIMRSLGKKYGD